MYMFLIHAIVLSYEEAEYIRKEGGSFDFDICASGDYAVNAIYDERHEEIIYLEDNIHGRPDEVLEGIKIGIEAAGGVPEVEEMVIILPKGADPYSISAVTKAMWEAVK
jgi:hypothetical protein